MEEISIQEEMVRELEDCKCIKISLEEKLVQLESELEAKDAIHAEATEVKDKLSQVRRESRQFQQMMKKLEEERDECLVKS